MKIYKKLLSYVPESLPLVYIAIFCSIVSAFVVSYGYFLIYKFLKVLIVEENLILAKTFALKIVLTLILGAVIYFISVLITHKVGFHLETVLRKRGIEGLSKISFRFLDINSSGKIRKTIDDNAAQTHTIVAHLIPDNSKAIVMPILVLVLGFFISVRVGLTVLVLTIIAGIILAMMMGGSDFMKIYQESLDNLSNEAVEYVRGISVIKVFGVSVDSMKKLFKLINDYSKYAYAYSKSCKIPYVFFQILFFGGICVLIIPISYFNLNIEPKVLALELMMSLFLIGLMFTSFMQVMYVSMYTFQGNYAVDTLEKLYSDIENEKIEFGNLTSLKNSDIEFKNVSFSYGNKKVLDNLSFVLEKNKTYALVGSSGSGKSTIAKLISGFYKVDDGEILIGGDNILSFSEDALIKNISFVFQDSKLFKKSIYENIALAKKNATKDEVLNAMKLSLVDKIIEKFKDRENTLIGSKGVYLSGGEIQRIAIARAILKDSKIVIMDEASASIDPDNEYELQLAFKNLMKNKTVVMIAHRLSSIKNVDEIILLENGKILERGSFLDLMNKDSHFKTLNALYKTANDWRIIDERIH